MTIEIATTGATSESGSMAPDRYRFRAVLTPYRALSPRGFSMLMVAVGLVSAATGLAFYAIGAWPVLGFFGLDVALIYLAFRLNYRAALRMEIIDLQPAELVVAKVTPAGQSRQWTANPFFVRVRLDEQHGGVSRLSLRSRNADVGVADFLSDPERRALAADLDLALSECRGRRI